MYFRAKSTYYVVAADEGPKNDCRITNTRISTRFVCQPIGTPWAPGYTFNIATTCNKSSLRSSCYAYSMSMHAHQCNSCMVVTQQWDLIWNENISFKSWDHRHVDLFDSCVDDVHVWLFYCISVFQIDITRQGKVKKVRQRSKEFTCTW